MSSIEEAGIWSRYRKTDTSDGKKIYFRCNKVKLRGPQCAAALYHLFKNDSEIVLEFRTKPDHNHEEINVSKVDSQRLKAEVERLFDLKLKPIAIMQELAKIEGIRLPTKQQLTTILVALRKQKFGPVTISTNELSTWLIQHSIVPENEHEPFVLCQEVNAEADEPYFRFKITTKYLLAFTKQRNFTHSDSTYKCIWQGFPVFMIGTTDWDKSYHPYGLCVSSYEKTCDYRFIFNGIKDGVKKIFNFEMKQKSIVCDAAFSISNAFRSVFGDDVIVVMCWFHAKRAMEENIKIVRKQNQKQILEDIEFLHIASTAEIFDNAADLFLLKWKSKEPQYCDYFETEWLIHHRNWFIGSNRYLKDSNTIRIRHPLPHFLSVMQETVGKWSKDYTIGLRTFANRPSIPLKLWTNSNNWAKANIRTKIIKETKVSVTVEVDAQIVQAKKRNAKEAVLVSESSSFQISTPDSSQQAKKRKIDYLSLSNSSQQAKKGKRKGKATGSQPLSQSSIETPITSSQSIETSSSSQPPNVPDENDLPNEGDQKFEVYKRYFHKWTVTIVKNENCLYESRCNCPAFGKEYICKHVIGLSIRLKLVSVPPEAKSVPIGQKRPKGRPPKTKPALMIQ